MSSFLYSLGRAAYRGRRLVVGAWIVLLAIIGTLALTIGQGLDNSVSIPGTESQQALDSLSATFPQVAGATAQIVIVAPDGIDDPRVVSAIESAIDDLVDLDQMSIAMSPFAVETGEMVDADRDAAIISLQLDGGQFDITDDTKTALAAIADSLDAALPADAQAVLGGQLFAQKMPAITITEGVGLLVALLVLTLTLGSLLAAGLPLVTALVGVGSSIGLIFAASALGPISSTTPLLALMLGLAVGIDYSLFIVSRYRELLADSVVSTEEAAARSVATAGGAVVFAGLTVMIALFGLSVAGIPFLATMGSWAAIAVGLTVLVALTLTPALLGFAGERLRPKARVARWFARRRKGSDTATDAAATATGSPEVAAAQPRPSGATRFFAGWVSTVTRRPIVSIVTVVTGLLLVAAPALSLRLALPDAGALPESESARVTYDLVSDHFGPGYNGPLIVTTSIITSTDPLGLMDDLKRELEALPGVASVPLATPNLTADTGIVQVVPVGGPDSEGTKQLVSDIRSLHDELQEKYGVSIAVTGFTAVGIDVSDKLAGALLPFGLLVVGLSLVLLTMVFRSIWVPITAALGYLLSVAAAFGVTTLVFEYGWLAELLHVTREGPVISFMPIVLMGVLFGLAMDYQVFLVSRIREDYVHSGDAQRSIRTGFVGSARVVTAAAVIMIAVFAAFVPEGDTNIKPIALGFAVGVFVDAFLVRMVLMPAILALLGERAWWMPAWLDRHIPNVDVEGESLRRELELADWPSPGSAAAVVADGLSLGSPALYRDVSTTVPAGSALIVRGESAVQATALLLTIAGRVAPDAGTLKVTGLLLPARAAAVRSRVGIATIEGGSARAVTTALAERPRILMIDGLDSVRDSAEAAAVRAALSNATVNEVDGAQAGRRKNTPPLTLVISTVDGTAESHLPPTLPVETLALDDPAREQAQARHEAEVYTA
ncbi:MAG: MMPL family transporter [Cryobacterium sp.]|nr:MMPL family transporter [Cryobacterium sp.]